MEYMTLIQTEELEQHLDDPRWIIMDCRFDLAHPEWGQQEYFKAHIPGAQYAHLDRDLARPKTSQTGRHPLPEPGDFLATLSAWGIDASKQVVVYDSNGGAYAVRLWWMLRYFGHTAAAVLDGGFPKWLAENRATRPGEEHRPPAHFEGQPQPSMLVDTDEVEASLTHPALRLVDARAAERFRGEKELIDPVAGHIPGALNRFHGSNLTPEGVFKDPRALRVEFEQLAGERQPQNLIFYCGSGVTSIHHILAMEIAGLPPGKLYVGSWSEWITDPKRPIATGSE